MPRNGQGVYSLPPVYEAVTGETIEAQQHNVPLEDFAADANFPRPVSVGGTGGGSAEQARENLDLYSKSESVQAALDAVGDLTAKETPVDADSVVITDSEDENKPKKALWSKVVNTGNVGVTIAAAIAKATPADGDFFTGVAAGGSIMFKTTLANIKAALRSAFDIVYVGLTNTQTITGTKIYQGTPGNIGANVTGIVEIQPQNGSNIDTFMSFHVPADARRVNVGMRPSNAGVGVMDSFGIGGGSLGANFYPFYHWGHFGRSTDANVILGGSAAYNVYTAGALLAAINNQANWYANSAASGRTAPQNCSHSSGTVEFGAVDVGYNAVTVDLPNPYVMTGMRSLSGSNQTYLRGKSIKNTA